MKALTIISSTLFGVVIVFLAFCFGQASFDITAWTEPTRSVCAMFMFMAGSTGGGLSIIFAK